MEGGEEREGSWALPSGADYSTPLLPCTRCAAHLCYSALIWTALNKVVECSFVDCLVVEPVQCIAVFNAEWKRVYCVKGACRPAAVLRSLPLWPGNPGSKTLFNVRRLWILQQQRPICKRKSAKWKRNTATTSPSLSLFHHLEGKPIPAKMIFFFFRNWKLSLANDQPEPIYPISGINSLTQKLLEKDPPCWQGGVPVKAVMFM